MSKDINSPPPKRGRPRSAAAKTAALTAARDLMRETGALTIEAVAQRAGVGKPTIYRHWANAQELAMAALMADAPPAPEPEAKPRDADPIAGLAAEIDDLAARLSTPEGRRISQLLAAAEADSELIKSFRNHALMAARGRAGVFMDQAVAASRLPADLDQEAALDLLFGAIFLRTLLRHAPLAPGLGKTLVGMIAKPGGSGE